MQNTSAQLFKCRLVLTRDEMLTRFSFFFFLSKALSLIIFSIIFRVSDQQIVGKESFTEFDF